MKISAATLIKKNFIKVLDLNLPKLKKGQVLVKIKYSSICHTQIQEIMGLRGKDRYLPHCLGHEATGLVKEVGPGVKKVRKNDKVCLTWLQSDGKKASGVKYLHKKKIINGGPVNTFSNYATVSENRILKLPKKNNLKRDVLMGCAIPTAFNAVFNTLKDTTKDNIIIFGTGGVGLACIFAARKVGFKKIFAFDRVYKKLQVAKEFGATDIILVKKSDHELHLKKYENFFQNGIECTGNLELMKNGLKTIKNFGGRVVIIGNYPFKKEVKIDPWNFIMGKIVSGAWVNKFNYDKKFAIFYNKFKKFKWKKYFGKNIYKLDEIGLAIKDLREGKVIRPLIKM